MSVKVTIWFLGGVSYGIDGFKKVCLVLGSMSVHGSESYV